MTHMEKLTSAAASVSQLISQQQKHLAESMAAELNRGLLTLVPEMMKQLMGDQQLVFRFPSTSSRPSSSSSNAPLIENNGVEIKNETHSPPPHKRPTLQ